MYICFNFSFTYEFCFLSLSSFVEDTAPLCSSSEDSRVIRATYLSRILISPVHWLLVEIYVQFANNDQHWFSPYNSSDSCVQATALHTLCFSLHVITFMTNTCTRPVITGVKFKGTLVSHKSSPTWHFRGAFRLWEFVCLLNESLVCASCQGRWPVISLASQCQVEVMQSIGVLPGVQLSPVRCDWKDNLTPIQPWCEAALLFSFICIVFIQILILKSSLHLIYHA